MSRVRSWGSALLALVLLAVAGVPNLFAQSDTTNMTGFVRDSTGATVPNATVSIRNEATGVERKMTTNQDGYFIATNLPAGFYLVTAEAAGFKKYESKNNKLDANIPATVDVVMQVGQVSETVEVTAQSQTVQADSATVGKVISQNEIRNIPLNGVTRCFWLC